MAARENKSFWETIPGIMTGIAGVVSAAAALIVALVSVGIIGPRSPTPQPSSVPTNIPTETVSPSPELITITITNHNCDPQDYYVDDVNVILIPAESTREFRTTAGAHKVYTCHPGTLNCGTPANVNWLGSTTASINRGGYCQNGTQTPASITITLTNNNCITQDYYVDGVFVLTIAADSTDEFQTTVGEHELYTCHSETQNCGDSINVNWIGSTTASIKRGDYCQNATEPPAVITITLTNNNCDDQDYYVDDVFALTISAESTSEFQTTPGDHSIYVCHTGTTNCGAPVNVNWTEATTAAINRGDYCP
ncbi:MAG TPA: hypothetical protein VJ785_03785 [Anaerolineales bacterium]|nr:hypothetical protein [Anaerolineales bacterium]